MSSKIVERLQSGPEWVRSWDPENEETWDSKLAWRTLWITTFTLTLCFVTWFLPSAIVPKLNLIGYHFSKEQLYWLTGNDACNDADYALLAPLYATSLAHAVHAQVQEDRYGETNKAARQARRERKVHDGVFHDYPGLAVQNMGGTKPQNISQLNSERRGMNYLLSSLPPQWQTSVVRLPVQAASVFDRLFIARPEVRHTVRALRQFLESDPQPNLATRQRREALLDTLLDELVSLAAELQRSLVRSHAASSGPEVEREVVRGTMLLRLQTLTTARTGARPLVAETYARLLNAGITEFQINNQFIRISLQQTFTKDQILQLIALNGFNTALQHRAGGRKVGVGEHAGLRRGHVAVVLEDVPCSDLEIADLRQRDEVLHQRRAILGPLAQPDRAHLGQRAEGLGAAALDGVQAGDEGGADGAQPHQQDAELALRGRDRGLRRLGHGRSSLGCPLKFRLR